MPVFDALIYNEDRHFGNFGLLRDNHTGQIVAPVPIFNNGLSLMAFVGKDDLDSFSHFEAYANENKSLSGIQRGHLPCSDGTGSEGPASPYNRVPVPPLSCRYGDGDSSGLSGEAVGTEISEAFEYYLPKAVKRQQEIKHTLIKSCHFLTHLK